MALRIPRGGRVSADVLGRRRGRQAAAPPRCSSTTSRSTAAELCSVSLEPYTKVTVPSPASRRSCSSSAGLLAQLVAVAAAELRPLRRVVAEPPPQLRAGRHLLEPEVDGRALLAQPARPQALHEDPDAVLGGRVVVGALQPDGRRRRLRPFVCLAARHREPPVSRRRAASAAGRLEEVGPGVGRARLRRRSTRRGRPVGAALSPAQLVPADGQGDGGAGRARSEYDVTDVAPRPLRKWSTNTLPPRLALDIVAVYLSARARPAPRPPRARRRPRAASARAA